MWTLGSDGRLFLCVSRRRRSEAAAARFSRRRRCSSAPTMKAVRFFLPSCLEPTNIHTPDDSSLTPSFLRNRRAKRKTLCPSFLSLSLSRSPRAQAAPAKQHATRADHRAL